METNKEGLTALKVCQSLFGLSPQTSHITIGPCPMQLVVVMAVTKAVSAATTIFTAISISRFFFIASFLHFSFTFLIFSFSHFLIWPRA